MIRRSKARDEKTFLLNAINFSEKSPAVEIKCPERNRPEWFMHKGSLWFSQRVGLHEGERESIYRCMPTVLILTLFFFLVVFFLSFPLVSFSISWFFFSNSYFLVKVPVVALRFFLFTARSSFYGACRNRILLF